MMVMMVMMMSVIQEKHSVLFVKHMQTVTPRMRRLFRVSTGCLQNVLLKFE